MFRLRNWEGARSNARRIHERLVTGFPLTLDLVAEEVGGLLVEDLRKRLEEGRVPGPAQKTHREHPWVDTGKGKDSIQVLHGGGPGHNVGVGVPPGIREDDPKRSPKRGHPEITGLFHDMEVGSPHYPPHPLLRNTVTENKDRYSSEFTKRLMREMTA